MPATSSDGPVSANPASASSSTDHLPRKSQEKAIKGVFALTNGTGLDRGLPDHMPDPFRALGGLKNTSFSSLPHGTPSGSTNNGRERSHSKAGSTNSIGSVRGRLAEAGRVSSQEERQQINLVHDHTLNGHVNGTHWETTKTLAKQRQLAQGEGFPPIDGRPHRNVPAASSTNIAPQDALNSTTHQSRPHRFSSPPGISSSTSRNSTLNPQTHPSNSQTHDYSLPPVPRLFLQSRTIRRDAFSFRTDVTCCNGHSSKSTRISRIGQTHHETFTIGCPSERISSGRGRDAMDRSNTAKESKQAETEGGGRRRSCHRWHEG